MKSNRTLKQFTIDEKIKWTSGNNMWFMLGNQRLGLNEILVADGPHGVRVYKKRPGHATLELDNMQEATLFPSAPAMASTWNTKLITQVGEVIGNECNSFNVDLLLAPGVNLKRSPLGGRNFEYYSEDPFLTGKIASSFINGVQSTGVGTCIKHFALNEQENQRRYINTIVDSRTLHEMYLKPFKMALDDAKPWAIMSSYNKVNHHYSSESSELLQDILRDKWKYDGVVISDWGGVQNKVKSIKHGCNIEMPGPSEFHQELVEALDKSLLSEEDLDNSLLPLFDLYDKTQKNKNKGKEVCLEKNHIVAQKVAEEAIVLLQNDGILPFKKRKTITVIGDFAQHPRINGGGSATLKPYCLENPLEELKKEFTVNYAVGYQEDETSEELLLQVENQVRKSDLVLFFTGTTKQLEVEGKDREHMNLPKGHIQVFNEISKQNKAIVTVLNNGSSLDVTPIVKKSNAIIESWFLGGANAKALVNILTGRVNPSGKLSETFPLCIEHTPLYSQFPSKEDHVSYIGDILNLGYRYYTTHKYPVRYPFGHGLSYTTFHYSNLCLDRKTLKNQEKLILKVDVTNSGLVKGKEVVQIYINDVDSSIPTPLRELVAFKKTELNPSETKTITFELTEKAFSMYNSKEQKFLVESGEFMIEVCKDSQTVLLNETIYFESNTLFKHLTLEHPLKSFYIYKEKQTKALLDSYKKFEWYEIEEPALRVLKRLQKEFKISSSDFDELLKKLLK